MRLPSGTDRAKLCAAFRVTMRHRALWICWGGLQRRGCGRPAGRCVYSSAGQLLDLYYNAKDAAAELIGRLDTYDTNDAELDEMEQRLDLLYRLKRKVR